MNRSYLFLQIPVWITTVFVALLVASCANDSKTTEVPASSNPLDTLNAPVAFSDATADVPGGGFYVEANNSAMLQGVVLGDGLKTNDALARPLPFRVDSSENGLHLLRASVSPRGSNFSYLFYVVENRSIDLLCEVKLEGYYVYDRRGQVVEDRLDFTYVHGSVGRSDENTARCVKPGNRVYMREIIMLPSDEIGGFSAETLVGEAEGFTVETNRVEPLAYKVDDFLYVQVANRGTERVELRISDVILVSESGVPLSKDLLGSVELEPGEESWLQSLGHVEFDGSVSSVRVILDYARTSDCRVFCN